MAGTIRQAPSHARQKAEPLGDMGEHNDDQTSASRQQERSGGHLTHYPPGSCSAANMSSRRREAPMRKVAGDRNSGPSFCSASAIYPVASLSVRMPPEILRPAQSRRERAAASASSIAVAAGNVAPGSVLPVELLTKSAPASIASAAARRI